MLVLVKKGYMSSVKEKEWNCVIQVWGVFAMWNSVHACACVQALCWLCTVRPVSCLAVIIDTWLLHMYIYVRVRKMNIVCLVYIYEDVWLRAPYFSFIGDAVYDVAIF